MKTIIGIFAIILLGSIACGGSSSSDNQLPNYSGIWDIRYNFSIQECQMTLDGIPGFVDQHVIEQENGVVSFGAQSGVISPDGTTDIRDDNALYVEEVLTGDLYGIGVYCEHKTSISYSVPDGDSSNSLFLRSVWCEDDWTCETRATGQAVRQPEA